MGARLNNSTRVRGNDPRSHATRQRLLDVALDVFCEQGFRAATVRYICSRASANVAAVSYHFQDKGGLYRAVIAQAKCRADGDQPTSFSVTSDAEADLRGFVRGFSQRLLRADECAAHGKLMAWEMIEPTRALDDLVRDTIRPTWEHLSDIVSRILAVSLSDTGRAPLVRRATASVLGQVLLYRNCRAVVERLHPGVFGDESEMEEIAEHIAEFSLAGLRGLREGVASEKPGRKRSGVRSARAVSRGT